MERDDPDLPLADSRSLVWEGGAHRGDNQRVGKVAGYPIADEEIQSEQDARERLEMPNPYGDDGDSLETDTHLAVKAWRTLDPAVDDDFVPPTFDVREDGFWLAPWVAEFRDRIVVKYGTLDVAESRIKFVLLSHHVRPSQDAFRVGRAPLMAPPAGRGRI